MNREEKEKAIERLRQELARANSVFVVSFEKIPVAADWELRKQVRAAGGQYRVVKNTLAARGGHGTPAEPLLQKLEGPTALALTETNPVALAKALSAYAKANPNFTFRAGVVEGRVVSLDQNLGDHRDHVTLDLATPEMIEQGLLQDVAQETLGIGHQHRGCGAHAEGRLHFLDQLRRLQQRQTFDFFQDACNFIGHDAVCSS